MAPSKASGLSAKKSKSSNSPSLKQGTLSFSNKRTSSIASATKGKKPVHTNVTQLGKEPETISIDSSASESAGVSDEEPVDSETHAAGSAARGLRKADPAAKKVFRSREGVENSPVKGKGKVKGETLDLQDWAGAWNRHYGVVQEKMGHLEPIHAEGQTKIHHILRVFDMSYEYGPCIGVTRLERWERAEALGLHPPVEVREILLTKQGIEQDEFAQCVLYGEV